MKKTFLIKTKRLILRDFVPGDWKSVHEYARDPKVVRFMIWGPNTQAQTRSFLKMIRGWTHHRPRRKFDVAVVLKSENRLIGSCGIRVSKPQHGEADMGYVFHRSYWGKGYATEAAKALIQFGFSKLKLHRIWATCDVRNKASARVMEKAGMKWEGHFRQNAFEKGRWRDSYFYAILKTDK